MKQTTFFKADHIQLRNFQGIKDFSHRLDGNSCLVIGSERAGKSNFINSIFMVLKQYPTAILKQGEKDGSAKIEISKGDIKYVFKFSFEEGEVVKMKTLVDGEKATAYRQADIIKMLTPKTFDIDALITSSGKKQSELILTAFGINVAKEEETYKNAFDERKAAKLILAEASNFPAKEKAAKVDTKALREKITLMRASNDVIKEAQTKLIGYKDQRKEIEDKLKEIKSSITKGEEFLKGKGKLVDLTEKEEELASAEVTNEKAKDFEDYLKKKKNKTKKEEEVGKWEDEVKNCSKAITDKINKAKLPVEEMEIKTDTSSTSGRVFSTLTYKGLPFTEDSINTGERIAIAAKLQMGLLKSDNLGVITINAGSIGDATIKSIAEECEKRGMMAVFELTARQDGKQLEVETVFKQ